MWTIDEQHRANTFILIFYLDGDVRGSITCYNREEVDKWRLALTTLNATQESDS